MSASQEALREDLAGIVGENLRSIAEYTADDYTLIYARDDVADEFTDDRLEEIREALVLRDFGRPYFQQVFDVGALHCTTYSFEEATVFHFVSGIEAGLSVSVDAESFEATAPFTERCQAHLQCVTEP